MSGRVLRARGAPAVGGFLFFASAALGAVYHWTGNSTADGNWSTTANWAVASGGMGTYPGANDDAVIVNANNQSTAIVNSTNRTIRSLFVGHGRAVQLDNALTLSPTVTPGTGKLEFNGSVAIKRSSGSVKTLTAEWMIVFSRDPVEAYTIVTTEASANIVVGS